MPVPIKMLLVSYHYLPYNTPAVYRIASFVRYLTAAGCDVVVLTSNGFDENIDHELAERLATDVPVYHTASGRIPRVTGTGLGRRLWNGIADRLERRWPLDRFVLWTVPALFKGWRIVKRHGINVVLVSAPPHSSQLIGLGLKRLLPIRFVSDFRDSWTHDPMLRLRGRKPRALHRWVENHALTQSDLILAISRSNEKLLREDFAGIDERVGAIFNGYFPEDVAPPDPTARDRDRERPFRIVYTGELYPLYAQAFFKTVAQLAQRRPDLASRLTIDIAGLIEPEDHALIDRNGLGEIVHHHGFVPFTESLRLVRGADIVLMVMPDQFFNVVSSKLFFYLGQRKTVLAMIPEGDAADIIREVNAGHVVSFDDLETTARLLEGWIYSNEPWRTVYNEDAWAKYSRKHQAQLLFERIRRIV